MTKATELVQIAQQCIGDAEHCFHIVSILTYNGAEVTGLRSSELSAISVTKRRVNLSATEVTFCTGQFFRMPRCPGTNNDDACDDRCVLVDDVLDCAVVVVDGRNSGFGCHGECITDVSRENSLVNRCEFFGNTLGVSDAQASRR